MPELALNLNPKETAEIHWNEKRDYDYSVDYPKETRSNDISIAPRPPTTVLLAVPSDNLRLIKALVLDILPDNDAVTVWSSDLKLFGCGSDIEEAFDIFGNEVIELYYEMKESKEKLGAQAMKTWQFLKSAIKEIKVR